MKKLEFVLILSVLVIGCQGNNQYGVICTDDCTKLCNPSKHCCYHNDCIPSSCTEGRTDITFYEGKDYVNLGIVAEQEGLLRDPNGMEKIMEIWKLCDDPIPRKK